MSNYQPVAGSVPQRAIEYMRGFAPGDEFPTATLCAALLTPSSTLITCMVKAKETGLVRVRKAGKTSMWSLGDGSTSAPPAAVPGPAATWAPPKMVAPRGEAAGPAPAPIPQPPAPSPAPMPAEEEAVEFDASLHLDGDLDLYGLIELENGGWRITRENLTRLKRIITWSSP